MKLIAAALVAAVGIGSPGAVMADEAGATHVVATWGTLAVDDAAVWVADAAGFFKAHNLDVDLRYQAGSIQIPSVLAGEVQFATVGGAEVVSADAGGADLIMLATISPVYPYYFMVANTIKTPSDLRGKSIGITRFGDISDLAARTALKKLKIDLKDVTFVQVGSSSNRLAAMIGKATQAGVFQMPASDRLVGLGFHPLLDLAKLKIPAAMVITARRDWVESHKPIVQAYIDAVVQGLQKEKHDKAFTVGVLKRYLKSDDDKEIGATWDYYAAEVMPVVPRVTPAQFADALDELAETNGKVRTFDVRKVIDNSYVDRAAKKYGLR